ncbi:hypothetical protein TSAR_001754 [Trichomalopsis sarcophagae]|uniref:Transposase domain-containing protein n=1 Tax=Trichomalopsis sarcophagae TaxID=543379 RepID=A0A232ED31_9HYME|nr:hypothetical protein TSAR_001754 [Trichomalopsis sarcophagae]
MSSERTVRRRVAEKRKLFCQEITECLNNFPKICENLTSDNSDGIEKSKLTDDEIPSVNPALNFMCLMNTLVIGKKTSLDELIASQFKHCTDKAELSKVQLQKEVFDIDEAKIHEAAIKETATNSTLTLNNGNELSTGKSFNLRYYLQNCNDEESDEESNSVSDFVLVENDDKVLFMDEIRQLCLKYIHIITHEFTEELLSTLRKHTGTPFPKSAKTFFKTPRKIETRKMASGEYCHYGLESAIRSFIDMYLNKGIVVDCVKLIVGIDGAPLATSSEKGLWIIACSETVLKLVEVLAIYHGEDKPPDVNEFLKQFKEEITFFINNGIEHKDKHYCILFYTLVCDAPAKAYVLCVKYPSGYFSCTKCTIRGQYHNAVHFPGAICSLRTDEKVKSREYNDPLGDDYQKQGETILKDIPKFGLVTNVVLDYMHLICLGVMLKLTEVWIKSILCESEIEKISEKLSTLKNFVPSDFCRNPRQFKKIRRLWKATELRQFLLYTGPVVLLDVLPTKLYTHFLSFHIAISILVNPILCKSEDYLNYADELLKKFVKDFEEYYGGKNVTFNVHNLLHIVSDTRNFGPLDDFSAFRFENLIRKMKQLVRKGDQPLVQIGKRLAEIKSSKAYSDEDNEEFDVSMYRTMQEIYVFKEDSIFLDCRNTSNNCILLNNGTYMECHYFIQDKKNSLKVVGNVLKVVENFYKDDFKDVSDKLHVKIVRESKTMQSVAYPADLILAKVCKFPLEDNKHFVVIPLVHTYKRK